MCVTLGSIAASFTQAQDGRMHARAIGASMVLNTSRGRTLRAVAGVLEDVLEAEAAVEVEVGGVKEGAE